LEVKAAEAWKERVESEIENAATRGAVVLILSAASIRSRWQQWELAFAAQVSALQRHRAHIVPVYVEGFGVLREAPGIPLDQVRSLQGLDFSQRDFEKNVAALMKALRQFEWRAG
jgi:hypothetical protein